MRAQGAVVLPFPTHPRALLAAFDGRPLPRAAAGPAAAALPLADPPAWAPHLALAAPLLLAPQAGGTPRDLVAVLLAILAFALATRAASPGAGPRERGVTAALALLGAAALGPAVAAALALAGLLETARRALGRRAGAYVPVLLAAAAVPLRLDAGYAALGLATPPLLLAAAVPLGLLLALAAGPAADARGRARPPWRGLALLAFATLAASLYAAALLGDPWVQRAGGVWPLLSVPPLLAALLRCAWPRGPGADPWLAAAGVAWAAALAWALPAAQAGL
jgi:hypothetical protein